MKLMTIAVALGLVAGMCLHEAFVIPWWFGTTVNFFSVLKHSMFMLVGVGSMVLALKATKQWRD